MRTIVLVLALALVFASAGRLSLQDKVTSLILAYGNPGNTGVPTTGAILVNEVHHLQPSLLSDLMDARHEWARERDGFPLLVATDHEGGRINRFGKVFPDVKFHTAKELSLMGDLDVEKHAAMVGELISQTGVNMLLAPSLDVSDRGTAMDVVDRSFGSDPRIVAEKGQAFVDGLLSSFPGLAVFTKHFPGFNEKDVSHSQPIVSTASREDVTMRMAPFLNVKGTAGTVVSNVRYQAFGGEAALFTAELIDMYRASNPNAVVVSDDLTAASLLSPKLAGLERAEAAGLNAVKAFTAGCDMLQIVDNTVLPAVIRMLVAAIRSDASGQLRYRLDDSFARVEAVRENLKDHRPRRLPVRELQTVDHLAQCLQEARHIRRMQEQLIAMRYLKGTADGTWTPESQAALNKFLASKGKRRTTCLTRSAMEAAAVEHVRLGEARRDD